MLPDGCALLMIVDVKPDGQGYEGRNVTMAAVLVVLDEQQHEQVQRLPRAATTAARTVLRAQIVLAAAAGQANAAIARDLRISVDTVQKRRRRFARLGLAGLTDLPRSGRPRRYDAADRLRIAALATSVPPHPESTWSHTRIAEQMAQRYDTPISASHVGRILTGSVPAPRHV